MGKTERQWGQSNKQASWDEESPPQSINSEKQSPQVCVVVGGSPGSPKRHFTATSASLGCQQRRCCHPSAGAHARCS